MDTSGLYRTVKRGLHFHITQHAGAVYLFASRNGWALARHSKATGSLGLGFPRVNESWYFTRRLLSKPVLAQLRHYVSLLSFDERMGLCRSLTTRTSMAW